MTSMMENYQEILLKNLKLARKRKGITMKTAGEFIGVSEGNYYRMEKGNVRLSAVSLYILSKKFEVSMEDLFDQNLYFIMQNDSIIKTEYKEAVEKMEDRANADEIIPIGHSKRQIKKVKI